MKCFDKHRSILQAKEKLYDWYWTIPILTTLVALCMILFFGYSAMKNAAITIIGGTFAFTYFIQKQKLEETILFRQAFARFNKRYDKLNEVLFAIKMRNRIDGHEDHNKLVDYFNLCAEEYLLYRKGYIPIKVWNSWLNGMNVYWENEAIRKIWVEELKTSSYYGFEPQIELSRLQILISKNT